MPLIPGELCQLWHYTRCAPAEREHQKGMEVEARSERAVSHPSTTEAVTMTEESGHVTTTRTTTTTIITTVTEVTRTHKETLVRPGAHAHDKSQQRRSIGYR